MSDIVAWAALAIAFMLFIFPPPWLRRRLKQIDQASEAIKSVADHAKDPAWVGAMVGHALTYGAERPDGKPVAVADVIQGIIEVNGPVVMARLEAKVPEWLPHILQQQNPGQALAQKRWGDRGGSIKKVPTAGLGKIGEIMEGLQGLVQLVPMLKGLGGGGGGGGGSGKTEWRPPV